MISVVTVVKNDKDNIAKTMMSVLSQKYKDVEYIIKNAYSEDGTTEIINNIKNMYTNKKVIHINQADSGIYSAMNQAVSFCAGDWIIFLNSGDVFYNNDVLENVFGNRDYIGIDVGVLYGDAIAKGEAGSGLWKANMNLIGRKMPFCHQSCFIRRDLLVKYPFSEKYRIASDYSNILDLYQANEQFVYINAIVSVYSLNGVSSSNFVFRHKEKERVRKEHGIEEKNIIKSWGWIILEQTKELFFKILPKRMLLYFEKIYMKFKYSEYSA